MPVKKQVQIAAVIFQFTLLSKTLFISNNKKNQILALSYVYTTFFVAKVGHYYVFGKCN